MINFYKLSSRLLVILFFILSTLQTMFELQDLFGLSLSSNMFLYFSLLSFFPIGIILFMTNYSGSKTERIKILVVREIRSLMKIYNYFIIFFSLIVWSIVVVSVIGMLGADIVVSLHVFSEFILNRLFYSAIYAILIISFFYGLSDINNLIKRIKDSNGI